LVVSVVRLKGPMLEIDGVLADGTKHCCKIHSDLKLCQMPDGLVGRQQIDGSWIKTVLEEDKRRNVQSVLGNGPPRFDLITHSFPWEKARFQLRDNFSIDTLPDPIHDIHPEHLTPSLDRSNRMRNFAAYSEAEIAEKELRRQQTLLSIAGNLRFDGTEFLEAKTYICSWFGVVDQLTCPENNGKVRDNINDLLRLGKRVIFVTNSSHWSRKRLAQEVVKAGIKMTEAEAAKHVLNTAFTCAWFLKKKGRERPFVICSETGILEELRNCGVKNYVATIADDGKEKPEYLQKATAEAIQNCVKAHSDVDCVVMGWDFHLTVLKVAVANAYIRWNSERSERDKSTIFGSNSNSGTWTPAFAGGDYSKRAFSNSSNNNNNNNQGTDPFLVVKCSSDYYGLLGVTPEDFLPQRRFNNRSIMTVGNGLMAEMLAFDNVGTSFDVGKPSELMLEALRRPVSDDGYGVDLDSAVVIGDELKTDITLAQRGRMKSLLVLSGRTTTAILEEKAEGETIPTWVVDSLAEIL